MPSFKTKRVAAKSVRYQLIGDSHRPLSFQQGLQAMQDEAFAKRFKDTFQQFPSFFLEFPPVTAATLSHPFEFVVTDAPSLRNQQPDVTPFAAQLKSKAAQGKQTIVFSNLGGDANLVVPTAARNYANIATFTQHASIGEIQNLWTVVAKQVKQHLNSQATVPVWISTHGGGVAWLHVRLDSKPKYYSYKPYKSVSYRPADLEKKAIVPSRSSVSSPFSRHRSKVRKRSSRSLPSLTKVSTRSLERRAAVRHDAPSAASSSVSVVKIPGTKTATKPQSNLPRRQPISLQQQAQARLLANQITQLHQALPTYNRVQAACPGITGNDYLRCKQALNSSAIHLAQLGQTHDIGNTLQLLQHSMQILVPSSDGIDPTLATLLNTPALQSMGTWAWELVLSVARFVANLFTKPTPNYLKPRAERLMLPYQNYVNTLTMTANAENQSLVPPTNPAKLTSTS